MALFRKMASKQQATEKKKKLDGGSLKRLLGIFRFMAPYKGYFVAGMICLFFSSTVLLAFPYFTGELVNAAVGVNDNSWLESINQIALALVAVFAVQSIFSFFRILFFAQVTEHAMADLREALYRKYISLPMAFFDKRRAGELFSRITADVSLLQDTFSTTLAELFRQVSILVFGVSILFFKNFQLTAFMLLTFPVLVVVALVFGKSIRKLSKNTQDELASTNVIVEEMLQSVSVVKAFTNELFEINRYSNSLQNVVKIALRTATFRGAFVSFIIFGLFGGIVLVLWYGTTLVSEGAIKIGDLFSFIIYTMFIGGSIAGLGDIYGKLQKGVGASDRVQEILDEATEYEINEEVAALPLKGNILYENVRFAYPTRDEIEVLKGVNLEIGAGEKVAFVGASGAGKSTMVQTLLRFYDLNGGSIKVDGEDIAGYDLIAYRSNIGIVPQEVILFGGTIRENIAYGKPGASESEIIEAAQKANAYDFIMSFPEGLDTLVGERGVKLSGGQRQRIAIARAILKDPAILILDEATSSLDAESEKLVQDALNVLMEGRTTIIIAHRLTTIREVDKICVLDNGQIVEMGAHNELADKQGGIYNNLLNLQMQNM
ncbi:ABC transporter transmembrane domain-containing protein [Limibacter armeniacum]|uniref:ABC transporter ATP-binding protein n=1 Tax=Limibacter armeniacum TaxID=466084 RepID=UPI002FE5A874